MKELELIEQEAQKVLGQVRDALQHGSISERSAVRLRRSLRKASSVARGIEEVCGENDDG